MPRPTRLPADQRRALTPAEAAAALSISRNTFDALVAGGEIPLVTFPTAAGTTIKLVRMADLDAFLARHLDGANVATIGRKRVPA
jgi:excisionase family DNA binding protein